MKARPSPRPAKQATCLAVDLPVSSRGGNKLGLFLSGNEFLECAAGNETNVWRDEGKHCLFLLGLPIREARQLNREIRSRGQNYLKTSGVCQKSPKTRPRVVSYFLILRVLGQLSPRAINRA
ncbi:hypothetical protein J6590_011396 [Homalodisca vitripennis]|nr:hypothetical protein J6590_011396 [Homalodisca vitripennis]